MGIHDALGQVNQLLQGDNGGIAGHAGGETAQSHIVKIEAVAIEGCQFVLLCHREAVGGAVLHTVSTKDAHPEIDGVIPQLLLLGGLVHHPIHHRQIDRTHPHTHLAGDALIKFVVDTPPVTLGGNQLFVGVLNRDRPAAQVVKGDPQALGEVVGRSHRITGVVADFLKEPEHGLKGERARSGGRERDSSRKPSP